MNQGLEEVFIVSFLQALSMQLVYPITKPRCTNRSPNLWKAFFDPPETYSRWCSHTKAYCLTRTTDPQLSKPCSLLILDLRTQPRKHAYRLHLLHFRDLGNHVLQNIPLAKVRSISAQYLICCRLTVNVSIYTRWVLIRVFRYPVG